MHKITAALETIGNGKSKYRVASIANAGRIPSRENPGGNRLCAHVGSWLDEEQLDLIACEFTVDLVSDARIRRGN